MVKKKGKGVGAKKAPPPASPPEDEEITSAVAIQIIKEDERSAATMVKPDVMENILKVLQEPAETMYCGLSTKAQYELSPQEVRELRELYSIFDVGSSGLLSYPVLRKSLRTMGFTAEDTALKGALTDCNIDIDKGISFSQFVDIVLTEQGDSIDVYEELLSGFSAMDVERSGKITVESLKKLCCVIGEDLTVAELEDMISEADTPGNGEISQKEFLEVMLRTNLFRGTIVDQNR